jgi:hypothetical protein
VLDLENVVCVSPEIVALVIRGECCLGYPWRSLSELALEIVVCVIRGDRCLGYLWRPLTWNVVWNFESDTEEFIKFVQVHFTTDEVRPSSVKIFLVD